MWYWTQEVKKSLTAHVMNLKYDEKEPHYFEISTWFGDKKKILSDNANMISGKLVKIGTDSYEWNNKTIKTLSIILDDNWERIERQTTYNNLSRSVIYSLASLDKIEHELYFSLYVSKAGKKNVWVKHWLDDVQHTFDWEKDIKWRTKAVMDWDEFVRYNYSELDKWINEDLIPKINKAVVFEDLQTELEEVEKNPKIKEDKKQEEFDDDLPF